MRSRFAAFSACASCAPSGRGRTDALRASKKEAMRARSDGGEIAPYRPRPLRASFPSRQAYHGAGNRLAPAAHFSEGGKTAYCNACAYAICPLRRDVRIASGRRAGRNSCGLGVLPNVRLWFDAYIFDVSVEISGCPPCTALLTGSNLWI